MASAVHPDLIYLKAAALDLLFDWYFWAPGTESQEAYARRLLQSYWTDISAADLLLEVQFLFPEDVALLFRAHCATRYPELFASSEHGGAAF